MANAAPKDDVFVFRIERTLNAPRERVWKAWTDPEQFKLWFGPKGCTMLYSKIDLKPGGASSYGMEFGGFKMFGQWAFQEIVAPEKIVAVVSFLDEQGNKTKHPMVPTWPTDILSTVTFTDLGDKTLVKVEWIALKPTPIEYATFSTGAPSMQMGWGGTFEQLEEFLSKHE